MANWVLSIQVEEGEKGWSGLWTFDGNPSTTERFAVGPELVKALLDDARGHGELFEGGRRPITTPDQLANWGRRLHEVWFARKVPAPAGAGSHELWIESADASVLNLPWELVELSPNLPVGCDAAWSLRRTLPGHLAPQPGPLRPGPIRVLVLSAAPTDEGQLDYEREEELILQATSLLPQRTIVHFAETGTFEELGKLVSQVEPHIVHLSGHGIVAGDGKGYFAFEDDRGHTDAHEIEDLVAQVFKGSSVRLVFFNGCQTSQAKVAGLCQGAIRAGVPLAMGWSQSVGDGVATAFAKEFYERLARRETIPQAMSHASLAIRRSGQLRVNGQVFQDATYSLARLYASDPSGLLYDHAAPQANYDGPAVVYEQLGEGIKGLREGYIGRRREAQRLIPQLRSGETTLAVLTGIGGMGKSTLATRAANRLKGDAFVIVPVKAAPGATPAYAGQATLNAIVDALIRTFDKAKRQDFVERLSAEKLTFRQKLRNAIDGLNEIKALLVLDNFEDVLELETRKVAHEDLGWFLGQLALNLVGQSRAIVTCRYFPEDIPRPEEQPTLLDLPIPDFREHDFFKFLRRDKLVEKRIQAGELSRDLQQRLFKVLGGTPGFLLQLRTLLQKADVEELLDELEGGDPGRLEQARRVYLHKILAIRLFENLTPNAQRTTCQLGLSELPLPLDGVATIAELDEPTALAHLTTALNYGLAQRLDEPELPSLYQCPGLLRPWLATRDLLHPADVTSTQGRLGRFWRSSYEADREGELRTPIEVELTTAREHARQGDDMPTFQWATRCLTNPLIRRSQWGEARSLLEEIPEPDRDGSTWHALATIDVNRGDYEAAAEKFGRSLAMKQSLGDRAGEAATWHNLATIDLNRGDYEAAAEKFGRALDMRQKVGDREGEAATWHNLATIDLNRGDHDAAAEKFGRALDMLQKLGDRAGEAATWHALATIDLRRGDHDAAAEKFGRALDMLQKLGDRAGEAATWHALATIDLRRGDHEAASEKFGRALDMLQKLGDRAGEAATWHALATIDLRRGDHEAASEKFGRALDMLQKLGDRAGEAATWYQIGVVAYESGRVDQAVKLVTLALVIAQLVGIAETRTIMENLAFLFEQANCPPEQFPAIRDEVLAEYQRDRGAEMLKRAMGKGEA